MALVNHVKKEINAKIVYYGPGLSGKTTNVKFIYEKMKPEYRGQFKFLNTQSGKMIFFDFMRPEQLGIKDYNIRFHIYTVPGDIIDYDIWKTVLKGADGLVFVADSQPERIPDNLESLQNLTDYLNTLGIELRDLPTIFQCNKQDALRALTIEEMKEFLTPEQAPVIPASATRGDGVLGTLSSIIKMVLLKLREEEKNQLEEASDHAPTAEGTTAEEIPLFTGSEPSASRKEPEEEEETAPADIANIEELSAEDETDSIGEVGPNTQDETPAPEEHPDTVHIGQAELGPEGQLRLPITIRHGLMEKTVLVNVSVSLTPLETEQTQ